jgi:iron only hydrogenase large subunit-like protein
MDLLNPIYTEKAECQDCYKCVRECSVKAIRVEGGRAAVVPELCVLCGRCVQVCPSGAKRVRNDLPRVRRFLEMGEAVIASLAPSFTAEFPGVAANRMVAALRKLGFMAVSETALGADIVSERVARMLRRDTAPGVLISSACPTAVEYVKKYHPRFADRVTDLCSPALAHARFLKRRFGPCRVVFIGPCVSKKRESDLRKDTLDAAIDFMDLFSWFEDRGIVPGNVEPGPQDIFVPERAAKGSLYPVDGGMIASAKRYDVPGDIRWMSFSGISEIDRALCDLSEADVGGKIFLELLACPGGCVNGPRARSFRGTVAKRLRVLDYAADSEDRGSLSVEDMSSPWRVQAVVAREPDREALEIALRRTGKYSPEDELNCGGCGYDTCRSFARALLEGCAEVPMCVSYMRKLAQNKANGLLKSIPSGVVIVDQDLRVVECNRKFAQLLGNGSEEIWEIKPGMAGADLSKLVPFHKYFREALNGAEAVERDIRVGSRIFHATIFCIERGAYAGGVLQDVTSPWMQKDRVISQSRKVIQKNLAVVQKIAFLLGENAAESEAMLTSIIDSFEDGKGAKE